MQQFHFLTCGQLCAICPGLPTHMQSLKGLAVLLLGVKGSRAAYRMRTSNPPAAVGGGGGTLRLLGLLRRSSSILTYGPVWSTVRLWQAHTVWPDSTSFEPATPKDPLPRRRRAQHPACTLLSACVPNPDAELYAAVYFNILQWKHAIADGRVQASGLC